MDTFNQYENKEYDENFSDKDISSVRYDFPYEPEKFDLSEADFAPSTNLRDSGFNGSLSQNKELNNVPVVHNFKQMNTYSGNDTHNQMNGNILVSTNGALSSQNLYGISQPQVTQSKEKNHSLKLQVTQSEIVKKPIQADNSPGIESSEMAFQMNGHSEVSQGLVNPVYQPQLSSIPSLSSINSSPEYDKYPVQCNTPQTPKDPTVNPLEAQLSVSSSSSLNSSIKTTSPGEIHHKSDDGAMQDIPKLQNLKNDLKLSCESRDSDGQNHSQGQITQRAKISQSLPATLHQTVFQNGLNSSSSLPSELVSEAQTADENIDLYKKKEVESDQDGGRFAKPLDSSNESAFLENVEEKTSKYNFGDSVIGAGWQGENLLKNQDKAHHEVTEQRIVGFGNIDEMDDDTDLNAYLNEDTEEIRDRHVNFSQVDSNLSKLHSEHQNDYVMSNNTAENQSSKNCDTIEQVQDQRTKIDKFDMDMSETDGSGNVSQNTLKGGNFNTDSDLEILKILPENSNEMDVNTKSVVPDLTTNLSPVANVSLDSGVASMNDNLEENTSDRTDFSGQVTDVGARPKDSVSKLNRPVHLTDLSTSDVNSELPFGTRPLVSPSDGTSAVNSVVEKMMLGSVVSVTEDSRQLMENSNSGRDTREISESSSEVIQGDIDTNLVELRYPDRLQPSENVITGRPRSWSPSDSGQPLIQKQKRPTSLNLPPPPTINPAGDQEASEEDQSPDTGVGMETAADESQDQDALEAGT